MTSNETRFSEADLAPTPEEQRAARRSLADRIAASVAALAAGIWVGGMVALGACAAPFVFRMTPAPLSGHAMGAAFARFDQIAIGASVVILGAEVVRTWVGRKRSKKPAARVRRILAMLMALAAVYIGMTLTPAINNLHAGGAIRGEGPNGQELDRIHKRAELVGKAEITGGVALVVLHVFTLGARRPEDDDDDDDDAPAPLPPGPGHPTLINRTESRDAAR